MNAAQKTEKLQALAIQAVAGMQKSRESRGRLITTEPVVFATEGYVSVSVDVNFAVSTKEAFDLLSKARAAVIAAWRDAGITGKGCGVFPVRRNGYTNLRLGYENLGSFVTEKVMTKFRIEA